MRKICKRVAATFGAFILGFQPPAMATAQTPISAPDEIITHEPSAPGQASPEISGPALWKIGDDDTVIYLFGTVHALPAKTQWLNPHISHAIEQSDEIVTEVDLSDTAAIGAQFMKRALLPEGENLRTLMDEQDRKVFEVAMTDLGLPLPMFDRYKPWYAAMAMSLLPLAKANFTPQTGVEATLLSYDTEKTRKHTALETAEYQLTLFDSMPMPTQLTYLRDVAKIAPTMRGELDEMVDVWLQGDAEKLAKLVNRNNSDPELLEQLLFQRNRQWAEWIETRLQEPGTVFMAVGAGHLAGPGSVQEELAAKGLLVERVQ